jgi:hypothetical protein
VCGATTESGDPGAEARSAPPPIDEHPVGSNTATSPATTTAVFRVFLLLAFIGHAFLLVGKTVAAGLPVG